MTNGRKVRRKPEDLYKKFNIHITKIVEREKGKEEVANEAI